MRLIALIFMGFTLAAPVLAEDAPRLTVSATGKVEAVPDMATLTLGVTREAKTAEAAMDLVSADTAAILAALTAAGVESRDLQTRGLSLSPVWSSYDSARRRQITGFQAANTVTVRVRGLDGLGEVLDRVIAEGANTFQGLSFGVQEPEPLIDEARRRAVAEAMRKAALYAEAAGVTLGPVVTLGDSGGSTPRPVMMEAARMSSDAVPVAAGEVSLSATVTMVFRIGG